jgi:hypothetical protein
MIKATIREPPRDHSDAKRDVRAMFTNSPLLHFEYETISKALIRDNFQCIVTGLYDAQSVDKDIELQKEVAENSAVSASTQCAHIFPTSINMDTSGSNEGGAKVRLT